MKLAIIIFAHTDSPGDKGRAVNGLETAREALDHDDDVRLIFDGAGTTWVGPLSDADHDYHELYASIEDAVHGVCTYCAEQFGVKSQVQKAGVELLDEYDGHPSVRQLITDGYEVLTF